MNVNNAFLNGYLHEEVYMTQPSGVSHKSSEVCKLQKSLYGLKQAPRAWFQKSSIVIVSLSFVVSHHDFALFVQKTNARRIWLSLYVGDMIITDDDFDEITSLKTTLFHHFSMKYFGVLRYLLGIEVASSSKGHLLSQFKYITDLFECAQATDNKIVDTPLETSVRYFPSKDVPLTYSILYCTIVGSLVYLTMTPLNISHVVHVGSMFVSTPTTFHWGVILRIPE